ncbi:MAG TPA: thiamine pyrophosphate-dependent enzyme [Thermoanaerobaculia bacterium]|jgi:pyruvate/2-oxoglutarate/acetoin dehydrogenase E1 component/TPP-dependent pyruvate/acetoin dehydrogenase alpha subunit|nr:thiamine pyrophosphate-dependent enzyme [Thermoanaerobaculia bacterium]
MATPEQTETIRTQFTRESIIDDYRIAWRSRQASLIGRREVLTGKAKFGIFGDGKEVAQLAMARAFRKGDWRSGYYRDQTFIFAAGIGTLDEFFGQLYAHPDVEHDPWSGGRSMNGHFASRLLNPDGSFRNQTDTYNSSADVSPTGSQMPRLVGLAYASKLYREVEELKSMTEFSRNGDEIAWGTIGNASCAEGMFWEAVNAAGVLQVPMLLSIWDDNYGISVPNEFQVTKGHISELLKGFQRDPKQKVGYDIYIVHGWDYPALCETYIAAASIVRMEHVPAIIHVDEMTQPQGHSTSGSHERYKSKERLDWEAEFDCIRKMREWMIGHGIATGDELDGFERDDLQVVREAQRRAWDAYRAPIDAEVKKVIGFIDELSAIVPDRTQLDAIRSELQKTQSPYRRDSIKALTSALIAALGATTGHEEILGRIAEWRRDCDFAIAALYDDELYSGGVESTLNVAEVKPQYGDGAPEKNDKNDKNDKNEKNGSEIINACLDAAMQRYPNLIAMGEDVGKLGDVNQGCAGLQEKYGLYRVSDTGIRECTIVGQAIGMALRGLRPIAEIQYLDYILYAIQILSDDLATTRWRTRGGQKCPVIIRTRGHRLEGIWHSGSPMSAIINLVRGMRVCVPRNMTQAAGFYNTMFRSDDPALVVEVLNGYRIKEPLPSNIADFTIPLGVPEVLRQGKDVTLVSYGATLRIVMEAAELLAQVGIDAEVIDVQTLLPFDVRGIIVDSLKKTNRVAFIDEDVPGGATAYMMQNVLERDRGYDWLDSEPRTLPAKEHRPAYGSDGDYWSKPNRETIFEAVYELLHEAMPRKYPRFL